MQNSPRKLAAAALLLVAIVGSCAIVGCNRDNRHVGSSSRSGKITSSNERSQTLLATAANQLADLPELSITELRPPSVILDSSHSSDGQDVMAELVSSTTTGPPVYNQLQVPGRNARFQEVGVRAGDFVKWYANQKSEIQSEFNQGRQQLSPEQMREVMRLPEAQRQEVVDAMVNEMMSDEGEILSVTAFELPVAQVIDSNTLMVDLSALNEEELGRLPLDTPLRLEVLRYRDSRFSELVLDLRRYAVRGVPLLGWEPSPDQQATEQIVERLNQWLRQTGATVAWTPTKLLDTLPESLRKDEKLGLLASVEALDRSAFSLPTEELRAVQAQGYEGRLLQEATWARDISNWVTADVFEPRARADRLFDWTVRNLQLELPSETLPPFRPWQSLVHGRASAEGRAWVFADLCRQQGIPVVVARVGGDEGPLWCCAVVDDELQLYDPQMGLAILNDAGQTATLREVVEKPELLDEFNADDTPYLPNGAKLADLTLEIVADPLTLSRRAALLEERLTGDAALFMYVNADALAAKLAEQPGVGSVNLWAYPFQIIADQLNASPDTRTRAALAFEPFVHKPNLWKARLLAFRGDSGQSIDASRGNLETTIDDQRDAGRLYTSESVRPTDATIAALQSDDARRAWTAAKQNATYWQGLLSFDRGDFEVAENWLEKAAEFDDWREGSHYNRARALEAQGDVAGAQKLLESSTGPQSAGNKVRARRLAEGAKAE
jgi:tetratricopeptide (TPR) repeat protein